MVVARVPLPFCLPFPSLGTTKAMDPLYEPGTSLQYILYSRVVTSNLATGGDLDNREGQQKTGLSPVFWYLVPS